MARAEITSRRMSVGIAVAAVYLAAVAGTAVFSDRDVRPLFDGFEGGGPPRPYQWVDPPPGLGSGNTTPRSNLRAVGLDAGTSEPAGVTSADSQLVLNLPAGAFPAEPGASAIEMALTPLDPKTLGSLPAGYLPDGNAYRVRMTYRPSGGEVPAATVPGNIVMIVPQLAVTMLHSEDGQVWEQLPTQLLGDPVTIGTSFTRSGYYLVGTTEPPPVVQAGHSRRSTGTVVVLLVAAVVSLTLFLANGRVSGRRRSRSR